MDCVYFIAIVFTCMLIMTALPWLFAILEALFRTSLGIITICVLVIMAIGVLSNVM